MGIGIKTFLSHLSHLMITGLNFVVSSFSIFFFRSGDNSSESKGIVGVLRGGGTMGAYKSSSSSSSSIDLI
ncbi:MAG: hypothetical protein ACFFAO_03885 [Candidatus Hermodarchaeota archaeon]